MKSEVCSVLCSFFYKFAQAFKDQPKSLDAITAAEVME